jgi:hypothetical protein
MERRLIIVAISALGLGTVFGKVGLLAAQENFRNGLSSIQSLSLIVATAILALGYHRKGCNSVAAGFLPICYWRSTRFFGGNSGREGKHHLAWSVHCTLGGLASVDRLSGRISVHGSSNGHCEFNPVLAYCVDNFLGRGFAFLRHTSPIFRLPVAENNLYRLDVELVE